VLHRRHAAVPDVAVQLKPWPASLEAALHHRPVKEILHSNDRLQRLQRHGNFRPAGRNRPEMEVWHGQIQSQLTTFDENSQDIG
jgi:hypothetical protein